MLSRGPAVLGFALLLCGLTMLLSVGAQASKPVYFSFCSTLAGTDGGQCNTPRGIAANTTGIGGASAGDIYVVDSVNNRIQQFSAEGIFIRAFGRDVIIGGRANDNGTGYEICDTTAGNVKADCKAGINTPAEGGTLSTPQGIAINQATGHLYVSNQLFRIEEFDATGHFVRAFGQDVVSAGPGNAPAAAAKQTLTVDATAGQFKLSFRGQTSADIAFDATAAQVDTAFEALNTVGANNVAVTGGPGGAGGLTPYVITFSGVLNNAPMPLIGVAAGTTPLSSGAGASVANTTTGATGYEICNAPSDTCKTGTSGATAGAFAVIFSGRPAVVPTGPPNAGNVLVADPGNRRVNEYSAAGAFVRSFGFDVVNSPPNSTTTFEICSAAGFDVCKAAAAAGSSVGQFAGSQPNRVGVDASGTIYTIESTTNFRVQKFTPAGASLTPAIFNPPISINPPVTLSGNVKEIAVAPSGGLFVVRACTATDCPSASLATEHRVYEFNAAGTLIDTHLANASFGTVNGFGLNSATGHLYIATTSEVDVLADVPGNAPFVTTGVTGPGATSSQAILTGTVDPAGFKLSDCHFEYGPTAAYGKSAPCSPPVSEMLGGGGSVAVSASTEPLEPETVYHYRLFASNIGVAGQGKDRTFTTPGLGSADACPNAGIRAQQGIEVVLLPDCLALEQVSPAKKGNQGARIVFGLPRTGLISPDGDRVLFNSLATIGSCPNLNALGGGEAFIASRVEGSGWGTECTTPPVTDEFLADRRVVPQSLDSGLSSWFVRVETPAGVEYLRGSIGPSFSAFTPPLNNLKNSTEIALPNFLGASADHSHLYLWPEVLNPPVGGAKDAYFLPGDPSPPVAGTGEDANLYVSQLDSTGQPVLELVARDRTGKIWGAECGARLGGMEATFGPNLNLANGLNRNQGAISATGEKLYFSTRPSQPASGNCTDVNKKRIMVREETPAGPEIKELIASECTRVSPTACSATDGDDVYQGASVDQKLVYFNTSRQLADTDFDGTAASCDNVNAVIGCDLYLYDENKPLGEQLVQVSAGEAGAATPGVGASVRNSITAIAADGSHVYFVARTVLTTDPNPVGAVAQNNQDNLYVYSHSDDDLAFVGTLSSGDGGNLFGGESNWSNGAYAVPIKGSDEKGNSIGGDGHILLFLSKAQLTAGDTDSARDLYRYDADAGELTHVSAAGPGGSDDGAFDVIKSPNVGGSGTDYADQGRWASEDGESVVFTTAEALLAGDANGVEDSYLWRDGQLFHLPGSAHSSTNAKQIQPVLSSDGAVIGYHSIKRLTASDVDSTEDVYVLRPGGGFPVFPKEICEGEACQGAPAPGPGEIGAITGSFSGAGRVPSAGCPKGKRKVRRGGKVRCVKKKPAKHKKQASKKRAGAKQGGQK